MIKKQRLKSDFKIKSATINYTFDNILNICFSSVLNTFLFFFHSKHKSVQKWTLLLQKYKCTCRLLNTTNKDAVRLQVLYQYCL